MRLPVTLVVLAACGSSVAKSAGSTAAATRCGPASASTLAANGRVRVYAQNQVVYGCLVAWGRSFRLGYAARALSES